MHPSGEKINAFWFRRDLRLHDNAGLYHALRAGRPVLAVFIFDTHILERLQDRDDARVSFLHQQLAQLKDQLEQMGSSLLVRHGRPLEVWRSIAAAYPLEAVYTNRDYEAYALERDQAVKELLAAAGAGFHTFKDHVIFEGDEVLKADGKPYTVFSPYGRRWREKLGTRPPLGGGEGSYYLQAYPTEKYHHHFLKISALPFPSLASLGFEPSALPIPPTEVPQRIIQAYDLQRNTPSVRGTSRLGIHFRFGTISLREKARRAMVLNDTYLNELIWRDFYAQILYNFPQVEKHAFNPKYEHIPWRNNEQEFERWCAGRTGYPIVDAGMRELNATGFMHNRVRMITASFLTKHLLIDWRWGEAYFARKLLDFDLASNNGGWQWAAGSGTDAAPYFRVFNPFAQQEKFDPQFAYVKQWVPEWGSNAYPAPMVDHKIARERCLATYKQALGG